MLIRDLTEQQIKQMKKHCMKEYDTYTQRFVGVPEQIDLWKLAFSKGLQAGLKIAPDVIVRENP
jgi:hypothetical protein